MRSRGLLFVGGMLIFAAGCASAAAEPTATPTAAPTEAPTAVPTEAPTAVPTEAESTTFVPSIIVNDQDVSDGTVTIDEVVAAEPGWIVIHAEADGGPGAVIGHAAVVVGHNANLLVAIDLDLATDTLYAMLHLDSGVAGEYEFPDEDAPVFDEGGDFVLSPFELQREEAGAGETSEARVVDSAFRDKEISVPVGTTIIWVYDASLPHTVTSDDGFFNSGTLGEGDTFSFTFTEPGTFLYYCRFHGGPGGSGMSGVITVTEG